jgi:hypothetical protein
MLGVVMMNVVMLNIMAPKKMFLKCLNEVGYQRAAGGGVPNGHGDLPQVDRRGRRLRGGHHDHPQVPAQGESSGMTMTELPIDYLPSFLELWPIL